MAPVKHYEDGDMVWAKARYFPWWPCIVFNSWEGVSSWGLPSFEKNLPMTTTSTSSKSKTKGPHARLIVMFLDEFNFQAVNVSHVFPFASDFDLRMADFKAQKKESSASHSKARSPKQLEKAIENALFLFHVKDHVSTETAVMELIQNLGQRRHGRPAGSSSASKVGVRSKRRKTTLSSKSCQEFESWSSSSSSSSRQQQPQEEEDERCVETWLPDPSIQVNVEMTFDATGSTPLSGIWQNQRASGSKEDFEPSGDPPMDMHDDLPKDIPDQVYLWQNDGQDFIHHPSSDDGDDDNTTRVTTTSSNVSTPVFKREKRRSTASSQKSQLVKSLLEGSVDPHTMVECEQYPHGLPSVEQQQHARPPRQQPYQVIVHPEAAFVCDLHAHLAECEIIGFLGGKWDPESKTVYIQAAFPCRSLDSAEHDGSMDVEMDPISDLQVRDIVKHNSHLEIVGWYHSHPQFQPDPSIRDIENQTSYQSLFEDRVSQMEPFVGLIVGTYDLKNKSGPKSIFRYFHIPRSRQGDDVHDVEEHATSGRAGCRHHAPCGFFPMELQTQTWKFKKTLEYEQGEGATISPSHPCCIYPAIQRQLGFHFHPSCHTPLWKASSSSPSQQVSSSSRTLEANDTGTTEAKNGKKTRHKKPRVSRTHGMSRSDRQARLVALKVKLRSRKHYGSGVSNLIEQCLALLDYYQHFPLHVNLKQKWKQHSKVWKVEQSLRHWVSLIDLRVEHRDDFIEDLMTYLELAW